MVLEIKTGSLTSKVGAQLIDYYLLAPWVHFLNSLPIPFIIGVVVMAIPQDTYALSDGHTFSCGAWQRLKAHRVGYKTHSRLHSLYKLSLYFIYYISSLGLWNLQLEIHISWL